MTRQILRFPGTFPRRRAPDNLMPPAWRCRGGGTRLTKRYSTPVNVRRGVALFDGRAAMRFA